MNRLPMREKLVNKYLDKVSGQLFTRDNSFSFRQRLSELNSLKKNLEQQEKEVYKIFNVTDINQLNDRIQQYQGLLRLGGSNLSNEIKRRGIAESTEANLDDLMEKIVSSNAFQDAVKKHKEDWSGFAATVIQNLNISGENFRMTKKGRESNKLIGMEKLLKDVVYEGGKVIVKSIPKKNFSTSFIKHLESAFLNPEIQASEVSATAFITISEQNREKYAGWGYTEDQIKNDPKIEEEIRRKTLQLCFEIMRGTPEEEEALRRALARTPISTILTFTTSGIQGALGEIALGAFIDLLTDGQLQAQQVGDVKNLLNGNKQIAVDLLLSHYGFQVKNYNEFAYGIPNSIVLNRENKLSTWEEKFDLDGALSWALDVFYGIRWFNQQYHEDYADTQARILQMEQNLNDFYARYPDKILRMAEDIQGASLFNKSMLEGRFYNTFYFVGGKKFLPSSLILQRIIDYFENNFMFTSSMDQTVYSSSSYNGRDITSFLKKGQYEEAPSLASVTEQVKVKIEWRLDIDAILYGF